MEIDRAAKAEALRILARPVIGSLARHQVGGARAAMRRWFHGNQKFNLRAQRSRHVSGSMNSRISGAIPRMA
jgi:hypothetical protein